MSEIERVAREFRAALLANDAAAAQRLAQAYDMAYRAIQFRMDTLTMQMKAAKDAGETLSPSWLFRRERLQALEAQALEQMRQFARVAGQTIRQAQRHAALSGEEQARLLAQAGLGPGVVTIWKRLPAEALNALVGVLGDGSPLSSLLDNAGQTVGQALRKALVSGLALGLNPREIARQAAQESGLTLNRALVISRTETLRAYRTATIDSYAENEDIVTGWVWMASLSGRTCPACLAMHGTFHPTTEKFGSHPNCRCVAVPQIKGAANPVEQTGEDWLRTQTADVQEQVLGRKAATAYRAGEIGLQDLLGTSHDAQWGTSRFTVSLAQAREAAQRRSVPAPAKPSLLSVADAYKLPAKGKYRDAAETALDAINVVHKDGQLPTIPVKVNAKRSEHGAFARHAGTGKSAFVSLSRFGDHPELTFVHETGHFLDWEVLGPAGKYGSESLALTDLMQTIKGSAAIQEIERLSQQYTVEIEVKGHTIKYPIDRTYLRYLLSGREQFARAYAQYIAVRGQNATLLTQLQEMRERMPFVSLYYPKQWEEEDFAPIAEKFDTLFESLGWRVK